MAYMSSANKQFSGNNKFGTKAPAPRTSGSTERPKATKSHRLVVKKANAKTDEGKAVFISVTGLFRDEGRENSQVKVTPQILDALKQVELGDYINLYPESSK